MMVVFLFTSGYHKTVTVSIDLVIELLTNKKREPTMLRITTSIMNGKWSKKKTAQRSTRDNIVINFLAVVD